MKKAGIKYINGLPTRASLKKLITSFDDKLWRLRPTHNYGKKNGTNTLMFYDDYTQSRMPDVMKFLTDNGITLGKYTPYKSPAVGFLEIKGNGKVKVTKEYLADWINKQLPSINDEVRLTDITFINKNSPPHKGFVYKICYHLQTTDKHPIFIYSFYSMKEIEDAINRCNMELYWKFKDGSKWIMNSEIDVRKINGAV